MYDEVDVRDAKPAHQLLRGGFLLEEIAPLLDRVRSAGELESLEAALSDWLDRLSTRGPALLTRGWVAGALPRPAATLNRPAIPSESRR
ncbi:hypothetical protein ACFT2C_12035 [Promicromonospora sp. NPDC057138]|uniref:hypothetical protein n=1 Tax=Promicromonospora sp. NPDC057138 TaxID=3346031 RepID=UPI003643FB99